MRVERRRGSLKTLSVQSDTAALINPQSAISKMRLSRESHEAVEQFFRAHTGDPRLKLPPVFVYGGLVARLLMLVVGMSAITFGRRVFVRPSLLKRDAEGRTSLPGGLLVHEVAHVLQYERRGYARFFRDYLRGYWRGLRAGGRWNLSLAGRTAAYLSIAEEREAREAEHAYSESKRQFVSSKG